MNIFRSKMEDLSSAEVVRFRSKISLGKQIKFLFESQEFIFLRFLSRKFLQFWIFDKKVVFRYAARGSMEEWNISNS